MTGLEKIEIDLGNFKIILGFPGRKDPLVIHFDTPSRRFYFSIIALVAHETQKAGKPDYIFMRKHENILKFLDKSLAGQYASKNMDGLWEKIRKSWRYTLPELETTTHFKIENKALIQPYEKGGRYRYACSEAECDIWANLFQYDESNTWRFKFAIESALLDVDDVRVFFNHLEGVDAWNGFLRQFETASAIEPEEGLDPNRQPKKRTAFESIKGKKLSFYILCAAAIVGVVVASVAIINRQFRSVPPVDEVSSFSEPSIAVLPFVNLSEDPRQEYFADGITENIITALSKIPHLFVISRTSAFTYKGKPTIVQTVSEELGVRFILEGSVQVSGEKLRVTAQLIDAVEGFHIWSGRYDRELKDIFALQDEITMQVITELQVELTEGEKVRIWTKGTKSLEAQLAFIQGTHHFFKSNPDDLLRAIRKLEKAILLDPSYAEAYGFLSFAHHFNIHAGRIGSYTKAQNEIYKNAQKALELDASSVMGHLGLSSYYLTQRDFDKCVEYAKKAVDLSPNNSMTVRVYGVTLMISGFPEKAIPLYQRSLKLDPKVPTMSYMVLGEAYRILEEYETAISYLEKSLNDTPKHMLALLNLAACYIGAGRTMEAKKTAKKILEINPNVNVETFIQRIGHKDKAELKRFYGSL